MRVKIDIFSVNGGDSSSCRGRGELLTQADGFSVAYNLEGDDCLIEYRGGKIVQTRRGRLNFTITFAEGLATECVLSEGGQELSFPVSTKSLSAVLSQDGCVITLSYYRGEEREYTEVIFTAERDRLPDSKRQPRRRVL